MKCKHFLRLSLLCFPYVARSFRDYSHSIVAIGFGLISKHTLHTPSTSLKIRSVIFFKTAQSISGTVHTIASTVFTARMIKKMGLLKNTVFQSKEKIYALKKLVRTILQTVLTDFFFAPIFKNSILQQALCTIFDLVFENLSHR